MKFKYLYIIILFFNLNANASVIVALFRHEERSLIAFKDVAIKIGSNWVHYDPQGMKFYKNVSDIGDNYLLLHSFTNLSNLSYRQIKFWSKARYSLFSDYNDLSTLSPSKLIARLLDFGQSDDFPYMPDDIYRILKNKGFKILNNKKRFKKCII